MSLVQYTSVEDVIEQQCLVRCCNQNGFKRFGTGVYEVSHFDTKPSVKIASADLGDGKWAFWWRSDGDTRHAEQLIQLCLKVGAKKIVVFSDDNYNEMVIELEWHNRSYPYKTIVVTYLPGSP
jgi:hypothetical protein